MIFIPKNVGLSTLAITQKRVIYVNNFEFGKFSDFMNGADNITGLKKINDFAIGPIVDYNNEVTGLIYFYNCAQGAINLNTVKKMKSIAKLIGGCRALVDVLSEQLLIKVGLNQRMKEIELIVNEKEKQSNQISVTTQSLVKQLDTMQKDVLRMINRANDVDREIMQENPNYKLEEFSFLHPLRRID